MGLQHIALGTVYRREKKKNVLGAPWKVYAVRDVDKLPCLFYEMTLGDKEFTYREIDVETDKYNRVLKWVKVRGIFRSIDPNAVVSLEEALERLAQNRSQEEKSPLDERFI